MSLALLGPPVLSETLGWQLRSFLPDQSLNTLACQNVPFGFADAFSQAAAEQPLWPPVCPDALLESLWSNQASSTTSPWSNAYPLAAGLSGVSDAATAFYCSSETAEAPNATGSLDSAVSSQQDDSSDALFTPSDGTETSTQGTSQCGSSPAFHSPANHRPPRVYPCPKPGCNAVLSRRAALGQHKRCHNKKYRCRVPGCTAQFATIADRGRHEATKKHGGDQIIKCPYCRKRYTRKDNMTRHLKDKHLNNIVEP
ncbi:hypothetical protein VTK26DRAFT_7117 [Humicola hyalothermophila]